MARVIPWPHFSMTADLAEALDAIDLVAQALRQAIGERPRTGLENSALTVVAGLRRKHHRSVGREKRPRRLSRRAEAHGPVNGSTLAG